MGSQTGNKFTWVIKNFWPSQSEYISSDEFVIGGCKWHLQVLPRGTGYNQSFSVYLVVSDAESLHPGWRRHAGFSFTVVNQFCEGYSEVRVGKQWFDQSEPYGGFPCMMNLATLLAEDAGYMVNDQVKIVAEVHVIEVIDGQPPEEMVDVNGFQVVSSKADVVRVIFEKHPDVASECRLKRQSLRSRFINLLFDVMYALAGWPDYVTEDELSRVEADLAHLTSVGFKVDWLNNKVQQVRESKRRCARMREIEQQLIELDQRKNDLAAELARENAEILKATNLFFPYNDVLN